VGHVQGNELEIVIHLVVATLAGGLIGLERSYHGRPAGFRTHTLVCVASSLLMLVTIHAGRWFSAASLEKVQVDPTRMAQGIMTGIGFLGAGVIIREGLSVRGLTTAASIWITAAIGILAGIGFYLPLVVATALTLGVLTVFRQIEAWMPAQHYAHFQVRFPRDTAMSEEELRELVGRFDFTIANLSYRLEDGGRCFEYRMVIRSSRHEQAARLAQALEQTPSVVEFRIAPTGD
jgi:putative Mg2+ transporter-C (MgtC) family protein